MSSRPLAARTGLRVGGRPWRIAGWWLALGHVLTAVAQAVTIIGIPLAWANVKMIPVTCFPFGREVVPASQLRAQMYPVARA